jgi:Fe-Mn family superoxide dismutase
LNGLIDGTDSAGKSLEQIIMAAEAGPLFNNAAQVWNHTFFWNGMKPGGGGAPTGEVGERIAAAFGSHEQFVEAFKAAAVGRFGSGWAWLVLSGGQLEIVSTPNAEMPVPPAKKALLTVDVWEHAYYLDYQNRRPDWVQTFFDKLVNWEFVAANLTAAR